MCDWQLEYLTKIQKATDLFMRICEADPCEYTEHENARIKKVKLIIESTLDTLIDEGNKSGLI
jgi:hypothetical protein